MLTATRTLIALIVVTAATSAQALDLVLDHEAYIYQLNFFSVEAADFDDATGRMWIGSTKALGDYDFFVAEIDPQTGQDYRRFRASVVPGMMDGVSALAIHPVTGNLFLFDWNGHAGEVTQDGVLVHAFSGGSISAAAFDSAADLYVVAGSGAIHRVNQTTGAYESTVPINGYSGHVSAMDFDPAQGTPFVHADEDQTLLEIDMTTGDVLSETPLSNILYIWPIYDYSAAFAFNADGTQLYLANHWYVYALPTGGETLYVIDRKLPDCVVFSDLGQGLEGTSGETPWLWGGLIPGTCDAQLTLLSSAPGIRVLVVGLSPLGVPFKGGVLVPSPDLLLPNAFPPSALFSVLSVDLSDPALVGLTFYAQVWIADPFGLSGYLASNGLSVSMY